MNAPLRRYRWAEALAAQGRSLTWLAERTGVARVTVYSYSQGRRRPPKAWLERTAEVLGVPASTFVDEGTPSDGTAPPRRRGGPRTAPTTRPVPAERTPSPALVLPPPEEV